MPRTVQASFDWFRREVVDRDSGQSDRAKTSREYLFEQLRGLRHEYPYPPRLFGFVPYGSFARKTKVRPLDDIDFLAQLDGSGLLVSNFGHTFYLHSEHTAPLSEFADASRAVNSIRVLDRIRDGLDTVANYNKAEIRRNQEVVALSLASYPWTFDIAPAVAVMTTAYYGAPQTVAYYLIPDGGGNWKRTNPHLDDDFIRRVNQRHGISVPAAIRLVKFWNAAGTSRYCRPTTWRRWPSGSSSTLLDWKRIRVRSNSSSPTARTISSLPAPIRRGWGRTSTTGSTGRRSRACGRRCTKRPAG